MAIPTFSGFTNNVFRITVVAITSVAAFGVELWHRVDRAVRDYLGEVGPSIRTLRFSIWPRTTLERALARMPAPVAQLEPSFVGGGAMFRRWR